jgi:putative phosphoesterase
MLRVGLISDTHGLLRPEVAQVFSGVGMILHAGDVGSTAVLDELELIAPVQAVLGNTDSPHEMGLRQSLDLMLEGLAVHVSHGHEAGAPTPEVLLALYDSDIIVFGHTHRHTLFREGERIVINPGAAGPQRFSSPPTVAILTVAGREGDVRFVHLNGD